MILFRSIVAICAKERCFWLSHQPFQLISLPLHWMPRCTFPLGIPGNVSSPLGLSSQAYETELPDIMYVDFLKACDKVCHKTLLQRLSGHIW